MTQLRPLAPRLRTVLAALAAVAAFAVAPLPASAQAFQLAAADCYSVGQRVARQNGGTLLNATAETQGGQTVCRVVVRVPGGEGKRPQRAEFVVPQQ
ncbi:hypothetical protein N1F89_17390 [Aquibium sp. A9E412]|uniref:hypothetical protein n=1 Tax=Aquibium sp. A9E412 TaxID=2976767 RepID=UPI0025B15B73|nr:hypothetical protein [Aquibium sp. A9E412]MDN2568001.1 hypothetical protein [Aquibium sp. A9E412]